MMPAPRSKPSSTTYATSMNATKRNQTVSTLISSDGNWLRVYIRAQAGSMLDFPVHEEQKEDREKGVESHESEESEQAVPSRDICRIPHRRSHQPIDHPRLAAHFRAQPYRSIGDIWNRQAKHNPPQQ